jgi:hypothetical protein
VAAIYFSLPWVQEAAREAAQVAQNLRLGELPGLQDIPLLQVREDAGGPVNPQRTTYQAQLASDMKDFLADIEKDQPLSEYEGEKDKMM